jgi:hypothetical protein
MVYSGHIGDSSFRAHSDPPANGAFELADQAATELETTVWRALVD